MPIETVLEIVIAVLTVLASIKKLFGKFRNKEIIIKSIIPRLASGFVGREKEIDKIRKYIQENNNIILVSGMGGIGKAEICKKLFHEYKKNKDGQIKHVCWVSWNRNLKKTLIANKNFEKIKEYINGLAGSFLLFIDNMNEVPSEKDRLEIENLGCRTVIISRCERIGDWHVVPIGELSKDECVLVYKENVSRNVYDDNIVRQIVEKANNLTLVVKLLAKMARAARFTDLELLEELNKRGFNLEGVTEKIDEKTFHEHLKKLFDISKINKTEIAILKKFSLFPPMPLNKNKAKEWLEQKDLNNLNILANKSWLIETETGFSMHPVISSVFSEKHPKYKEYSNLVNMLGKSLDMDLVRTFKNKDEYASKLELLPFGEKIAEYFYNEENENTASLLYNVARFYYWLADNDKALGYYKKVLEVREKILGKEHPDTATTNNSIARVYSSQGNYGEALELYKKVLEVREKILGKEHPDTATTYNDMAVVYHSQGNYGEALEFYKKALAIREKVLAKNPYLATTYNGMARVYSAQGKYNEALEFYKKALAIREKFDNKEHYDIAITYNDMGKLYYIQGNYSKALKHYKKALAIREKLDKKHYDIAITYNDIGNVYCAQGKYSKALDMCIKSYRIFVKKFGTDHPNSKKCKQDMEKAYALSGKTAKFESWLAEQNSHFNTGESS